jgi:hypothetical protein
VDEQLPVGTKFFISGNEVINRFRKLELTIVPNTVFMEASKAYQSTLQFDSNGVITTSGTIANSDILSYVGARHPVLDGIDSRIIDEVVSNTGSIPKRTMTLWQPQTKGFSDILDNDQDGMADSWELKVGLNPTIKKDGSEPLGTNGYTALEVYLDSILDSSH